MKLLKETTVWKMPTPSHVYIFDGDNSKIAGYIQEGTTVAKKFKKPYLFYKTGRTFKEVNAKDYDLRAF